MSIPQIIGVIELIICIWYLLAQKRPDTSHSFCRRPGKKTLTQVCIIALVVVFGIGMGLENWACTDFSRISPVRRRKVTLEIWSGFAVREMVL